MRSFTAKATAAWSGNSMRCECTPTRAAAEDLVGETSRSRPDSPARRDIWMQVCCFSFVTANAESPSQTDCGAWGQNATGPSCVCAYNGHGLEKTPCFTNAALLNGFHCLHWFPYHSGAELTRQKYPNHAHQYLSIWVNKPDCSTLVLCFSLKTNRQKQFLKFDLSFAGDVCQFDSCICHTEIKTRPSFVKQGILQMKSTTIKQ